MNNRTLITLARLACGTAIFITSMATGINGNMQNIAILLMAVPVEVLASDQKETAKQDSE